MAKAYSAIYLQIDFFSWQQKRKGIPKSGGGGGCNCNSNSRHHRGRGAGGGGGLSKEKHRVDLTESSSAQFSTWISNFGAYVQLKEVREHFSILLKYGFHGLTLRFLDVCKSISTLRNVLLYTFC